MQDNDIRLKEILESSGIPVKYRNIEPEREMTLPFIGFHYVQSENFGADNQVYQKLGTFSINLCTERKEKLQEMKVEQALDEANIYWEKYETYMPEEQMYQIVYEVTI